MADIFEWPDDPEDVGIAGDDGLGEDLTEEVQALMEVAEDEDADAAFLDGRPWGTSAPAVEAEHMVIDSIDLVDSDEDCASPPKDLAVSTPRLHVALARNLEKAAGADDPGHEDDKDDDDDDDLDAMEAAALAAFEDTTEAAEDEDEAEEDEEDVSSVAPTAPVGKGSKAKGSKAGKGGQVGKGGHHCKGGHLGKARDGRAGPVNWADSDSGSRWSSNGDHGKAGKWNRGGGKAGKSDDGGVAKRILQINAARHWPAGSGIDARVLTSLRELPTDYAMEILRQVEGKATTLNNPSQFCLDLAEVAPDDRPPMVPTQIPPTKVPARPQAVSKPVVQLVQKRPLIAVAEVQDVDNEEEDASPDGNAWHHQAEDEEEEAEEEDTPVAKKPRVQVPMPGLAFRAAPSKAAKVPDCGDTAAGGLVLAPAVAAKLEILAEKGRDLGFAAVKALSSAAERDALIVLQALMMREHVDNPSTFVISTLKKKQVQKPSSPATQLAVAALKKAQVSQEVAKRPSPISAEHRQSSDPKRPKAQPPRQRPAQIQRGSAPLQPEPLRPAQKPAAKALQAQPPRQRPAQPEHSRPTQKPAAKALQANPRDVGRPPMIRKGLDFEQSAVQAKVQALNKMGIWQGAHPLDEAALSVLLKIDPQRALEILDTAQDQGDSLERPSESVRQSVAEELSPK